MYEEVEITDNVSLVEELTDIASINVSVELDVKIANQILDTVFKKRRLLAIDKDNDTEEADERRIHFEKIYHYVKTQTKIKMVLPAFPVKSPNRDKTLGYLPDFAERYAFQQLNLLCEEINQIYSPGVSILVCSDGRVFSDLLTIPDTHVTEYNQTLRTMVESTHHDVFEFFNLDDVFRSIACFETMREELMVGYGEPLIELIYRTKNDPHAKAMYLGITRFIVEDYSGIEPFKSMSRTAIQKTAKHIAYRVIQRSNAWSRLLNDKFPDAVRLSIHPQFRVSEKIGIYLGDAENNWVTPWHSVAVVENDDVFYMKRSDIESQSNVVLAYQDGRPSHFIRQQTKVDAL